MPVLLCPGLTTSTKILGREFIIAMPLVKTVIVLGVALKFCPMHLQVTCMHYFNSLFLSAFIICNVLKDTWCHLLDPIVFLNYVWDTAAFMTSNLWGIHGTLRLKSKWLHMDFRWPWPPYRWIFTERINQSLHIHKQTHALTHVWMHAHTHTFQHNGL